MVAGLFGINSGREICDAEISLLACIKIAPKTQESIQFIPFERHEMRHDLILNDIKSSDE